MQEENSLIGFIEMLPMFFVLFSEGESLDWNSDLFFFFYYVW